MTAGQALSMQGQGLPLQLDKNRHGTKPDHMVVVQHEKPSLVILHE